MFSREVFSENSTKSFFLQPEGYQNTEEMLRVFRRQALQSIFHVRRMAVNHRKGQKQSKKIALNLKNTWARPTIYDWAYSEKPSTAFPSNQMSVTKPSLLSLFVQQDKQSSKELTSFKETYFLDKFRQNSNKKNSLGVKTCIETHCCTHCLIFFSIQLICITLRTLNMLNFR